MGSMGVRERDLTALMRMVHDAGDDETDPDQPLPWSALEALRRLVPADAVVFGGLDSTAERSELHQQIPDDPVEADPATAAEGLSRFFRHYWDFAPCSYPDRTGDLDRILRISDFYSVREVRRTGMWSEYLRDYGYQREMLTCVGGVPGRTLRLMFCRTSGRDFDDRDRSVVWLLRPHLLRLFRERRSRGGQADLTPRQRQLLRLVAAGQTNRQIGRRLGVQESTVRKHLENVFQRLDVQSRTAAVARAYALGITDD
jgi:DNA-binding CsgD family transcriptional regulator